jgi:ABC transporter substrate binding protein
MGHDDLFPSPRPSDRRQFCQETFARSSGNGRDAPKAAVRQLTSTLEADWRDYRRHAEGHAGKALAKKVQLHVLKATTEEEIDAAFASLEQVQAGALIVGNDPFFTGQREQIVGLASRRRIPAIYQFRDFVISGGLISYGVSLASAYRQAALLVAKILKGAKPIDLPVEQPAILELVINLSDARSARPVRASSKTRPISRSGISCARESAPACGQCVDRRLLRRSS